MEITVAKEGVHTQYSRSSAVQHCANNGKFSIFRALLHCYALCVDEGSRDHNVMLDQGGGSASEGGCPA